MLIRYKNQILQKLRVKHPNHENAKTYQNFWWKGVVRPPLLDPKNQFIGPIRYKHQTWLEMLPYMY